MEHIALTRTIQTTVHGRYLVRAPQTPPPWPALFTFHGYAEDAAASLAAVERIADASNWLVVAVQALHPFYTKNQRIVASWMTRQDREFAIPDNISYVRSVVAAVVSEFAVTSLTVFSGFSQGVAMAYRAAADISAGGVIALAGDVPADVAPPRRLPQVLIGRGLTDEWYTEEKMAADVRRLGELAVSVDTTLFAGGHEWTDAFAATASGFLVRLRRR
jgi:poly(3-hydroxybutyrate) depolymerase